MRALFLAATCLAVAPLLAEQRVTKQDAERFQTKLTSIVELGTATPVRGRPPRSIAVTDAEVNAYLQLLATDQIPAGIAEPAVSALGDGRVSGRALVDLDVVRKQRKRGLLDPMNYLSGRLPIIAAGRLTASGGVGHFALESAEISGISIPKPLLQELLSYYSRTPEKPSGIDMDAPFDLPSGIKEIRVGSGTATIVQ